MAVDGVEGDVDEGVEFDGDGGDAGVNGLVEPRVFCFVLGSSAFSPSASSGF